MPIFGWIILILIVLIILWVIISYNSLVRLDNDSKEAFSSMDVYLKKRFDLIPNLVETVKGYAKHESSTLENVVKARNMGMQASSPEEKINADNMMASTLKSLFALSEAYPDLKANSNFIDLQSQLKRVEDDIASSRRYYNAIVKNFNIQTQIFPSSIIASMFHFTQKPLYIIEEEQRNNVNVKF
jgi:LemA protein